jgi:hypothetical protein
MLDRQGLTFYERMERQDFLLESGKSWKHCDSPHLT